MKKILITGSNGQVGNALRETLLGLKDVECYFASRTDIDICNRKSLEAARDNFEPDYVINCAAYTAVDKAESDEKNAFSVNTDALKLIAETFAKAKIIHFSSDYVYHASAGPSIRESQATRPQGIYAVSKRDGERVLRACHKNSMVIRTSWVYHHTGHNFVKTMLRLGREKPSLTIVDDQVGAPTYAMDIAALVTSIVGSDMKHPYPTEVWNDTYNFSNEGEITWFAFAEAIKSETPDFSAQLIPVSTAFYGAPAARPPYSVLSLDKIKGTFSVEIRSWKSSLRDCLSRINV